MSSVSASLVCSVGWGQRAEEARNTRKLLALSWRGRHQAAPLLCGKIIGARCQTFLMWIFFGDQDFECECFAVESADKIPKVYIKRLKTYNKS